MATTAQKRKRKIQQFVWEGKDSQGKTVKGDNEAPNAEYVKATLRRQGIRPIKVRRKPNRIFYPEPFMSFSVTSWIEGFKVFYLNIDRIVHVVFPL